LVKQRMTALVILSDKLLIVSVMPCSLSSRLLRWSVTFADSVCLCSSSAEMLVLTAEDTKPSVMALTAVALPRPAIEVSSVVVEVVFSLARFENAVTVNEYDTSSTGTVGFQTAELCWVLELEGQGNKEGVVGFDGVAEGRYLGQEGHRPRNVVGVDMLR
jgi:hypothetical protein